VVHSLRDNKADWRRVDPKSWNSWQRLAVRTYGLITPANAITIAGLCLSLYGISRIYYGSFFIGLLLLGIGRLADILDGTVATRTNTRSHIGESLDAGTDKVVAGVTFIALIAGKTIPWLPVLIILTQNVISVLISTFAKYRNRELHPSNIGKLTALIQWLVLLLFICARAVSAKSTFLSDVLNTIGYMGLVPFVILGLDAIIGYARHGLSDRVAKKYTDNTGNVHQYALRLYYAYWQKKWLVVVSAIIGFILLFSVYSLAASPYSSDSFVQTPFTTSFEDGQVVLQQHFTPSIYHGWFASAVAYCEQTVTVIWDRLRSPKEPAGNLQSIESAIHTQRFDPSKPYVISGDQFDGLYLRNLSVFYQGLLDPHTALGTTDWHNRERIAVQSLAYGLSATEQLKYPVTTLMPIGPRQVIAVNFWSYPSDTMFGLLQELQNLEADPDTRQAALQLQHEYGSGLIAAYQNYLTTVRDPKINLIRTDIHLSSARDAVQRESSFYDNVILWRTEQLASQLGLTNVSSSSLVSLRQTILQRYWDATQGHFIDDVTPGHQNSYSSDWLIALPTGFLHPSNSSDLSKLELISAYIDKNHLTSPLPIRYTADNNLHQDFFVSTFVSSYGNTAIWSYWGDLYITLETDLYQQTSNQLYAQHVQDGLTAWQQVIVQDRGYPETLDGHGNILKTTVYESIRRNGWIVDFEADKYNWDHSGIIR
jgi:phosphatidylglycerophosphate synthase